MRISSILLFLICHMNLNASTYHHQVCLRSGKSQASDLTASPTVGDDSTRQHRALISKMGPCLARQKPAQRTGDKDSTCTHTSTSPRRSHNPEKIDYVKTEAKRSNNYRKSQVNKHQSHFDPDQNPAIKKLISEYKTGLYTMETVQNQLIALQKRFKDHLKEVQQDKLSNAVKMDGIVLLLNQLEKQQAEMEKVRDECNLKRCMEDVQNKRIELQKMLEQHLENLQQEQMFNMEKINAMLLAVKHNIAEYPKPEINRSREDCIIMSQSSIPQPQLIMTARTYAPQLPPTLTRISTFNPAAPFINTARRSMLTHYPSAPDLTPRMI